MTADLPGWARTLVREARVARLATVDGAGQPLVVPVCYALDAAAARIYPAVDAKPKRTRELRRLRNILENPRVSLVVDRWDEDWKRLAWVIVEGRAAILPGGAEREHALELLVAKYPQYAAMDLPRTAGAVVAIAVERTLAWSAG